MELAFGAGSVPCKQQHTIELCDCAQLDLCSIHRADQQTSQMLAQGRVLEVIRALRIMATAVAHATTALTNGLSAANQ